MGALSPAPGAWITHRSRPQGTRRTILRQAGGQLVPRKDGRLEEVSEFMVGCAERLDPGGARSLMSTPSLAQGSAPADIGGIWIHEYGEGPSRLHRHRRTPDVIGESTGAHGNLLAPQVPARSSSNTRMIDIADEQPTGPPAAALPSPRRGAVSDITGCPSTSQCSLPVRFSTSDGAGRLDRVTPSPLGTSAEGRWRASTSSTSRVLYRPGLTRPVHGAAVPKALAVVSQGTVSPPR